MSFTLATSYFYKVRFFQPWQIPLSTAVWDPAWFHDFKGQKHRFIDKRGVLNGLRAECLHPDSTCSHLCRGLETCAAKDPNVCSFLKAYRLQLSKISNDEFMAKLQKLSEQLREILKLRQQVQFVLLVHEPPYKACSERGALQEKFGIQELSS